jgi:hypothetical protein
MREERQKSTSPKEKYQMYCIAERVVLPPLSEGERKALLEKAALLSV